MKITPILMLFLLVLVFTISSGAFAQDDTPKLELPILKNDNTLTATFEDEVNAHLYAFLGSEGDQVTISMVQKSDSLLDPFIVLLGSSGEVYTSDDDGGSELLSAQIEDFSLPSDGSYFVLATSFDGLRSGVDLNDEEQEPMSYELAVSGNSVPQGMAGDVLEYSSSLMERDDSIVLELTQDKPVAFVTFVAEEGDIFSIATTDGAEGREVDTLMYLFDTQGNRIAVNDDSNEGEALYAAIEDIEIGEDGLHMVFVTMWNFDRAYTDDWEPSDAFSIIIK